MAPPVDGAGSGERPDAMPGALPGGQVPDGQVPDQQVPGRKPGLVPEARPDARLRGGGGHDVHTVRNRRRNVTLSRLRYVAARRIASGVVFRNIRTAVPGGPVRGALIEVDLTAPRVTVRLLRPPAIAARRKVSAMARARHALAAVNGDFFNISRTHKKVRPTGSSSGPVLDRGRALKGPVPYGQRFGPALPHGASAEDVIGIGADGRAHVARLRLTGMIRSGGTRIPLAGLNQYALPVGGAGAFTRLWGRMSRKRAVCGTDRHRAAPCSKDTAEVIVRRGVVTKVRRKIRGGRIRRGTIVLVGRDAAAAALRTLRPGDRVRVRRRLQGPVRFRFAVGGFSILRDGLPVAGLDHGSRAPRTAAGVSLDGRRMYLVVIDGRWKKSRGLSLTELAVLLSRAGADDAVNLDGGGSSTLVARGGRKRRITVRNRPSGGAERAVANGIGVFARHLGPVRGRARDDRP